MKSYIQIQWTTASLSEAEEIAKALLSKKWVACAQILPSITSFYLWEGEMQEAKEVKVFFKTKESFFAKIAAFIIENASYEIPEIAQIPIGSANQEYIDWLEETLK